MDKEKEEERAAELKPLKLYTLTELESIIGVSHRSLLNYVKSGRLHARKIGGKWRVTKQELEAFMNVPTGGEGRTEAQ